MSNFFDFSDLPKPVRIAALVLFVMFALIGFGLAASGLAHSVTYFLLNFVFFLLCGAAISASVLFGWRALTKYSGNVTTAKMENIFARDGWTTELAQTAFMGTAVPTDADRLMQAFLWLMAEDYEATQRAFGKVNTMGLNRFDSAVLHICRMQLLMMTGKAAKAVELFDSQHASIDTVLQNTTESIPDYKPYADYRLVYYRLAAAISMRLRDTEQAARYRQLANSRLMLRTNTEQRFLPDLLELDSLYAGGRLAEAHDKEQELHGALLNAHPSPAEQNNLLRMLGQSRVFGSYQTAVDTRPAAERAVPAGYAGPQDVPGLAELSDF